MSTKQDFAGMADEERRLANETTSGHVVEMERFQQVPWPEEPCRWRRMDSAPQMQKIIVTYVNPLGKRRTVMARYYRERSLEMDDDYAYVGDYNDETGDVFAPPGWYEEHDSDSPLMPLAEDPTHWMPLPAPPASPEVGEQT